MDITAKCDDAQHSIDETKRMLQHLLEERFSLKIHRETRRLPVYALTIAKGGAEVQNDREDHHRYTFRRALDFDGAR
jgi:uncharacterized protein (TIGR03435 family)